MEILFRSWRLKGPFNHDCLVVRGEAPQFQVGEAERLSAHFALWLLQGWRTSSPRMLRAMYEGMGGHLPSGLTWLESAALEQRMMERLEVALSMGELVVWAMKRPAYAAPSFSRQDSLPLQGEELPAASHWVEIALVGDEGQPLPGEEYLIKLPDGTQRQGHLDSRGLARIENIRAGTCHVWFPKVDGTTWMPVSAASVPSKTSEQTSWLEIELLDEDEQPLADEPYEVILSNGQCISGRLDDKGRALLVGIRPGTCHVDFPRLGTGTWGEHG